ncbi:MAG TPA: CocE/NonD family hydrolase [Solirubrobacterales bacterium]|nr:CocE/NonD family hydrolase [Solirubrobacterales bacterium]
MRKLVLVSAILGSLLAASSAQAAITDVFGGAVTCSVAGDGVRECGTGSSANDTVRSTAPTWDGTPIDVNVAFPDASEGDGPFPLIIWGHGYGGEKVDFASMRRFTDRGYAVFSMTDRGFHQSCGKANAIIAAAGACDRAGWIHLMDDRFEVRDAQFLTGQLADEGRVDGGRIGAIGNSYGGGLSLQLATLKDRVMMRDGSLVAWTSPSEGIPMRIAAAAPDVPWSDLAYALTPNGGTLDYVADSPYTGRVGVMKQSFQNGLYVSGASAGLYCAEPPYPPPCTDFDSDVTAWKARLDAGEPYDGDSTIASVLAEIEAHHSAYYIDHSEPPAPLMISNGFTDDLFPADEAIRYYNRIRSQHPGAPISMLFGDFGHMRAVNKPDDREARNDAQDAWLDFYVKGAGTQPFQGVTTFALTCPTSDPSGGPFKAGSWAGLQQGVVRLRDPGIKTISANGGSATVDTQFDPILGGGACAAPPADDLSGVATYRLPPAAGGGFTLMGSPTVIATISSPAANSEIAARLLDVDPDGTETLVARQLFRPLVRRTRQVFQLHPSGHLFAPGHVAKLELLPRDAGGTPLSNYGRPANGQGDIEISNLDLRLPVLEGPGAAAGQVGAAPPLPLPCGQAIAPQFSSSSYVRATLGAGRIRAKGKKARVPVDSAPGANACRVKVELLGAHGRKHKKKKGHATKKHKKKRPRRLGRGTATIAGGESGVVKVKLSRTGRRAFRLGLPIRVRVVTLDPAGNTAEVTKVKLAAKKHGKHKKHKR